MMRQMREVTKPIMLLAAIAFVALMVFEWGMDASGRSGTTLGEIGSVNGEAVMYESYMTAYRRLYNQVQQSQEELISSQQNKDIEDAAFDEVVNQLLIYQELERRGITVTNGEIAQAAQFNPPEEFRAQFTDANGGLDLVGYQSFLASMTPDQLLLLEGYYRDVIPRGKLFRQVSSGVYLSDGELWQQWKDQNELVRDPTTYRWIRLISGIEPTPSSTIPDSDIVDYYRHAPGGVRGSRSRLPSRCCSPSSTRRPLAADTAASREQRRRRPATGGDLNGADFAEVARKGVV